jgi:aldehyde dehydrogenase (NAD+)
MLPTSSCREWAKTEFISWTAPNNMKGPATTDTIKTITTHYIDGTFVPSHGREIMDIIRPTDGQGIARASMADEEDTRRAIAAAKHAFVTYGRSTVKERAQILRRLHETTSERIDDLTAAMVEDTAALPASPG